MATDHSPVRFALIVKVTVLTIGLLIAVRISLGAYFDQLVRAEELRKVGEAKPEALLALRADEHERLTRGQTPIENAMAQLAKHGRMALSPELTPTPSRDVGPLKGWVKMPAEVPPRMEAEAAADAGAAAEAANAGAPPPSDAGPAKNAPMPAPSKGDGGPPHKKSP